MKTIICGSRELCGFLREEDPELWDQHAQIFMNVLETCPFLEDITEVVSGKARGVDTLGEIWASMYNIPVKPFPADWGTYHKAAGPIRNQEMLNYCLTTDSVIAILRYNSLGTKDMIERSEKKGLRVHKALVEFQSYEEKHGKRPSKITRGLPQ